MCIVDVCGKTFFPEQIHVDKFGFYRPRTVGTSGCLFVSLGRWYSYGGKRGTDFQGSMFKV